MAIAAPSQRAIRHAWLTEQIWAVPSTTTAYSPTTGALISVTNGVQTQTTAYDTWGEGRVAD